MRATHVIPYKGYDSSEIITFVKGRGVSAVIPPTSSRKVWPSYDRHLYRQRNLIDRAFNKLESWRRIAARFDRRSLYYPAFLRLAAAVTWSA